MKKHLFSLLILLISGSLFAQEEIINSFDAASPDTNYWSYREANGGQHYETSTNADSALAWFHLSFPSSDIIEGSAAMQLDYSVQNIESWGGYTKLEHWNPDSNASYDWSLYDTLSVWYNNLVPASEAARVHLRINLQDVSDSPLGDRTYTVNDSEYWYSFNWILDDEPGWKEVKLGLKGLQDTDQSGDSQFHLTGWSGISGNATLDLSKIKGFSYEISINGSGSGEAITGTILFDKMALTDIAKRSIVFFNGGAVPSTSELFVWSGTAEVEAGTGSSPESPNAIKWVQGEGQEWSGVGFNIPPTNLSYHWATDTLKFKMKAETGTGNLRMQWEDGTAKIGANFDPVADDQWHSYEFPLAEMTTYYDGTADFDFDSVRVFQILTEGNGSGKTVYLDDWWTGNPVFDVVPPDAPALVSPAGGNYVNLITWADVPGETSEVYDVYYSEDPITDLAQAGLEVVQKGVAENLQLAEHVLRAPVVDQSVTYYYAVVCRDAAGNPSPISTASASLSNTAKGVTIINPTPPPSFIPDGDLGEWAGITAFRMYPDDGSGSIVTNQSIDNDADLSADAYLAVDNEYLYVAFNVEDDVVSSDPELTGNS